MVAVINCHVTYQGYFWLKILFGKMAPLFITFWKLQSEDRHSDETNRYIISVARPFKLIF